MECHFAADITPGLFIHFRVGDVWFTVRRIKNGSLRYGLRPVKRRDQLSRNDVSSSLSKFSFSLWMLNNVNSKRQATSITCRGTNHMASNAACSVGWPCVGDRLTHRCKRSTPNPAFMNSRELPFPSASLAYLDPLLKQQLHAITKSQWAMGDMY